MPPPVFSISNIFLFFRLSWRSRSAQCIQRRHLGHCRGWNAGSPGNFGMWNWWPWSCSPGFESRSVLWWRHLLEVGADCRSSLCPRQLSREAFKELGWINWCAGVPLCTRPDDSVIQWGTEQLRVNSHRPIWWDWLLNHPKSGICLYFAGWQQ